MVMGAATTVGQIPQAWGPRGYSRCYLFAQTLCLWPALSAAKYNELWTARGSLRSVSWAGWRHPASTPHPYPHPHGSCVSWLEDS